MKITVNDQDLTFVGFWSDLAWCVCGLVIYMALIEFLAWLILSLLVLLTGDLLPGSLGTRVERVSG